MAFECPKCGQPSEKEGLCETCTIQSAKLLNCPDMVEVTICSVCGSRLERGKWKITNSDVEQQASEAVCNSLCIHKDLEDPTIDVKLGNRGSTRYLAKVTLKGKLLGEQVEESCEIPVRIKRIACERCSRIAGKYFEATIQVRGSSSRPLSKKEEEECKSIAISLADSAYRNGDQLSFIQDIKEVKGGIDIILGSTGAGRHIGRAITDRFGGRTRESSKLIGKKDGKDIFRTTILVRFPKVKKGDILSFRGNLFEVTGFEGKRTLVASLENLRRTSLTEEDVDDASILGNRADAAKAVVITKDKDVLEIMDPENYKAALAPRPRNFEVEPGEEVLVIRTPNGFVVVG
ncbi:MAG: 60S ribosomal export protein NMD3 [Methanotrichaceae archaeon]